MSAHELMAHIDTYLLPLMRTDLFVTQTAVQRFLEMNPLNTINRLEEVNIKLENLVDLFPKSYKNVMCHIFRFVSFNVNLIGPHVSFLDILLILSVLGRGELQEKGKFLFNLFNFSGSGRMSELEVVRMVLKLSAVFQKLKLIGSLDVTEEDARHIGLLARLNSQKNFIPFLTLPDFQYFLAENWITKAVYKIFSVLDRLCSTITVLTKRSDTLLQELNEREKPMRRLLAIPRMDILDCKVNCGRLIVTFRGSSCCSMALHSRHLPSSLYEVFVLCKKINILSSTGCVSYYKEIVFYQRCILERCRNSVIHVPFLSTRLTKLESDCTYRISVYAPGRYFDEFSLRTLENHNSIKSTEDVAFVLFPASISGKEIGSVRKMDLSLSTAAMQLFTGPICDLGDLFDSFLSLQEAELVGVPDKLPSVVCGMAKSIIEREWESSVNCIYAHSSCDLDAPPGHVHSFGKKQVITYHPNSVLCSCERLEELRLKFGKVFFDVEDTLSTLLEDYAHSLRPAEYTLIVNSTLLVMMSDPTKSSHGVTVSQLCEILNKFSFQSGISEVIVVMSDPSFLMSPRETWASTDAAETGNPNAVKLTGAYEIKHGAYSAPVMQVASADCDKDLATILVGMFSWLGSNLYNRKISLVSCCWHKGYDFIISSATGSNIVHSNLLKTSSCTLIDLDAGQMDNIDVIRRVRSSCPAGSEFVITEGNSSDRVLIKRTTPSISQDRSSFSFIDITSKVPTQSVFEGKPLSIVHGPNITQLSDTEMHCEVEIDGYGAVTLVAYELPPSTNYSDAKSFLFYDRNKLKTIRRIDRRCIRSKQMIFKLSNLEPHTTYCAAIDLSGKESSTSVLHFRTLPRRSCITNSMMVIPVFERDICFPSYRISKAIQLIDR